MLPLPRLADDRVLLRPFGEDDVPAVTACCQDPLIQSFTRIPYPYGEDDAREFISGAPARRLLGESIDLAMADPGDDRLLGAIGLVIDRHDVHRAEIGYWVAPSERGRGVARRGLALMSDWAVTDGGFARLDLQAAVANAASIRVAESCGFVREGTLREAWYRGPSRTDMVLFSLLPTDPRETSLGAP
ncbi:MAG: GNAT family N-acetyltransferase [Thermoleophilia bacterium]|nr:GNAT family N-acetyltransferase [Thermoleophilia bacterium]